MALAALWSVSVFLVAFQATPTQSSTASSSPTRFTILDQSSSGSGSIRIPSHTLPTTAVVTSPGTKGGYYSALNEAEADTDGSSQVVLACDDSHVYCRGAQLKGTSDPERAALATTSLIASVVLVDGITLGDVQDLANSRHARTLTALFRARLTLAVEEAPQSLLLGVSGDLTPDQERLVLAAVHMLFDAAAIEKKHSKSFSDLYTVEIVNVASKDEAQQVGSFCSWWLVVLGGILWRECEMIIEENMSPELTLVRSFSLPPFPDPILPPCSYDQALAAASESAAPAAFTLSYAYNQVLDSKVGAAALDPPFMAHEFVRVGAALQKCLRAVRAKVSAMDNRVSRGLWMESFGAVATELLDKKLAAFDSETLSASGLPLVAPYRRELRQQLKTYLEGAITNLFNQQVQNLQQASLKRFTKQLVQNLQSENANELNAAALRKESFYFETVVEELQVPALGLTKGKVVRDTSSLLNDALQNFGDSPAAKIARTKKTEKVVKKERKPSEPAWNIGLDLVAVLRPDGFGSLQGFCGYQWRGNSLTVGVHNDADDPQVIAQFGGVRPPLLRVQPKLRVDLEL